MRKSIVFCLTLMLALLFPAGGQAQEATAIDVDACVEELNAQCPVSFRDDWGVNSFTTVEDRYVLVDIKVPANLSMILSSLSSDTDNVKRLWIKQLAEYSDMWKQFADKMVEAGRPIIINLHPKGKNNTALITLMPSDFKSKKP